MLAYGDKPNGMNGGWERRDVPSVPGVLGDFHSLDLLTERGAVTGAVLAGNTDLYSRTVFG